MIPTSLSLTNFRSWRQLDLDLRQGVHALTGPNGAGKSSILTAVEYALYGRAQGAARLATRTDDPASAPTTVELEFEHRGDSYRARRTITPKGAQKVDLEKWTWRTHSASWEPYAAGGVRDIQDAIDTLLGVDATIFRATSYIAQGDASNFTAADRADRRRLLARVLRLDDWQERHEHARDDRRDLELQYRSLNDEHDRLRLDLQATSGARDRARECNQAVEDARRAVTDTGHLLNLVETALAEARDAKHRRDQAHVVWASAREHARRQAAACATVQADIDRLTERLDQRDHTLLLADQVPVLEADLAARAAERERWHERVRVQDELDRGHDEHARLNQAAETAHRALVKARVDTDPECPTCGQHVRDDAHTRTILALEREWQRACEAALAAAAPLPELARRLAALPTEPPEPADTIEARLRTARSAVAEVAALDEVARELDSRHHQLSIAETERRNADNALEQAASLLAHADEQLAEHDLAGRERDHTDARDHADRARATEIQAERDLAAAAQLLRRHVETEQRLRTVTADLADVAHRSLVLQHVERAFSPAGIPTLILENQAIPQIEAEANRILHDLGAGYQVELRTQAVTQSGRPVDALDIVVRTMDGHEATYEDHSGGERTRIDLALRIALARLLATRHGTQLRYLAIDEPDGLDAQGMQALARVLTGLNEWDVILLVSHHPDLQGSFDQVITIEKTRDGSRLTGRDREGEGVAA